MSVALGLSILSGLGRRWSVLSGGRVGHMAAPSVSLLLTVAKSGAGFSLFPELPFYTGIDKLLL